MLVVYGSAHEEHKEEFLLELAAMCGSMQVPYIVGGDFESTSAPWVILVINVNISLVGLILLSSVFQICSTVEWHGQENVEPLQDAKDKGLAQALKLRTLHFLFQ